MQDNKDENYPWEGSTLSAAVTHDWTQDGAQTHTLHPPYAPVSDLDSARAKLKTARKIPWPSLILQTPGHIIGTHWAWGSGRRRRLLRGEKGGDGGWGRGRPTVKNRKAWGSPRRARRGTKGSGMGCHTTTVSCTTIDYRGPNASFGPPGIRGCQRPSHELPKFPFNFGPFLGQVRPLRYGCTFGSSRDH